MLLACVLVPQDFLFTRNAVDRYRSGSATTVLPHNRSFSHQCNHHRPIRCVVSRQPRRDQRFVRAIRRVSFFSSTSTQRSSTSSAKITSAPLFHVMSTMVGPSALG